MPTELKPLILQFLDHKGICRMQSVSKEWCTNASADQLWLVLFQAKYPKDPLPTQGEAKKKFKERILTIPIKDGFDLKRIVTSFFCNLKWNKKRELICIFPSAASYSLKICQSFGPLRGTRAGFEGIPDEKENYEFTGPVSKSLTAHTIVTNHKNIQCPESLPQTGIPLVLSTTYATAIDPNEDWHCLKSFITEGFVNAQINSIDVGYGNTLGYFSAINNWKSPFSLFCISDSETGEPLWVGLIPYLEEFKFVSINSQGFVTWEKKPTNRIITPYSRNDPSGGEDIRESINHYPIQF